MKGILISITGLDGSGKTTQVNMLEKALIREGYNCIVYRISSRKTPEYGVLKQTLQHIKNLHKERMPLETRALILAYNNLCKITLEIQKYLNEGYVVICDRYVESTDFYLEAQGIDNYWPNLLLETVRNPDIYIYLRTPVDTCYQRICLRGEELNPHECIQTLEKIYKLFEAKEPQYRYSIIDGSRPIDVVHAEIIKKVGEIVEIKQ